ncbi:hypothetical protein [Sphingomonas panaciterrae]|uniref:hypothetical protein n=1 Tax=Sphingomonas panaciterrae TaxID=1462999 RepID=UPI002FEF4DF4
MRRLLPGTLAAAMALTGATTTSAAAPGDYRPAFRPDQLKGPPAGAPNEVLVLGTVHLSGLGDGFRPAQLSPLLDRLARWQPTAIATESLSGLQCDSLRRHPARYADTVESYCPDTDTDTDTDTAPPPGRPSRPPDSAATSRPSCSPRGSQPPRWSSGSACPPRNSAPATG